MEGGATTSTKNGGSVDELGTFWGGRDRWSYFSTRHMKQTCFGICQFFCFSEVSKMVLHQKTGNVGWNVKWVLKLSFQNCINITEIDSYKPILKHFNWLNYGKSSKKWSKLGTGPNLAEPPPPSQSLSVIFYWLFGLNRPWNGFWDKLIFFPHRSGLTLRKFCILSHVYTMTVFIFWRLPLLYLMSSSDCIVQLSFG